MKCPTCNTNMVWKGSMLDGGMTCPSCVAGDTVQSIGITGSPLDPNCIVIDDPLTDVTFISTLEKYKKDPSKNWAAWLNQHLYYLNGNHIILSPAAANDYNDWLSIGGCSCHQGCAPCSSCTHPGNPASLENRDDCHVCNP